MSIRIRHPSHRPIAGLACSAELSISQPRKAGPVDDAAAKAARDFLLGNDLAAQALSGGGAGGGGDAAAGAKLLEVRCTLLRPKL